MQKILYIPIWVNNYITRNHNLLLKVVLLVLVLITALYTKSYRGDYQYLINSHIGGVFYVLFGSLAFSAVFPRVMSYFAVLTSFALTCLLEFIQYLHLPFMVELTRMKTFAYLFGTSFDYLDFVYYIAGALLGVVLLWMMNDDTAQKSSGTVEQWNSGTVE
jgi:hypothetical protein